MRIAKTLGESEVFSPLYQSSGQGSIDQLCVEETSRLGYAMQTEYGF